METACFVERNGGQRGAFHRIEEVSAGIVAAGNVPGVPGALRQPRRRAACAEGGRRRRDIRSPCRGDDEITTTCGQTPPRAGIDHAPGTYDTGASVPSGRPIQYHRSRNAVQTMPKTIEYGSMSVIRLPRPAFFE